MDDLSKVMILGDQDLCKLASQRLLEEGLEPICIGFKADMAPSVEKVVELKGGPGSFEILLKDKDGFDTKKAAFVLICFNPVYFAPKEYNNWIPLQRFLDSPPDMIEARELVILDPFDGKVFASRWQAIFDFLLSMKTKEGLKIHVISPQIKVARDGLERKYKQLREMGVIFYKPDMETLKVFSNRRIIFQDNVLDEEIELLPDIAVVMDEPAVPNEVKILFSLLKLETDNRGFPQAYNVLRAPFYTNRKGVYVVSPLPDFFPKENVNAILTAVIHEIKKSSKEIPALSKQNAIQYDQDNCAYCLTCLRVCPHGAILFDSKPNFLPLACERCGICVANCPGLALDLIEAPWASILKEIRSGLENGFRKVILACRRSGKSYVEAVSEFLPALKAYWVVELPCAGIINEKLLLEASLIQGVEKVLVLACKQDNCRTTTGTLRAKRAYEVFKSIMETIRGDVKKVAFVRTSSQDFVSLLREEL